MYLASLHKKITPKLMIIKQEFVFIIISKDILDYFEFDGLKVII